MINEQPTDLLSSFQDLLAWLIQARLLTEEEAKRIEQVGKRQGQNTLKQARAFRKVLRDMVRRLADGEPVPEAALETINHLLRRRSGYSHSELEDTNQLLGLLGKVASDLLVTCTLSLVKKCQNPRVRAVFLRHDQKPCTALVQHEPLRESQ